MQTERHVVLWDGECGMCRRFADWLVEHDEAMALEPVPYQQWDDPRMTPELQEACARAMHVVRADGTMIVGMDAVIFCYEQLGWRWLRVGTWIPFRWPLALAYKVVAANRRIFSKILFTGDQGFNATCRIDEAELPAQEAEAPR